MHNVLNKDSSLRLFHFALSPRNSIASKNGITTCYNSLPAKGSRALALSSLWFRRDQCLSVSFPLASGTFCPCFPMALQGPRLTRVNQAVKTSPGVFPWQMRRSLAHGSLLLAAASLKFCPPVCSPGTGHFLNLLRTHMIVVHRATGCPEPCR